MAKESNKERALTLEAIRVLDAIDRRGSFAAAADELGKVPSALSYTVQKLEDELDAMLFGYSDHLYTLPSDDALRQAQDDIDDFIGQNLLV